METLYSSVSVGWRRHGPHCHSFIICPILQQLDVFAERAFGSHIAEVKMKGCHRDRGKRKHKQSLTHSSRPSTSYWWNYPHCSDLTFQPQACKVNNNNSKHEVHRKSLSVLCFLSPYEYRQKACLDILISVESYPLLPLSQSQLFFIGMTSTFMYCQRKWVAR